MAPSCCSGAAERDEAGQGAIPFTPGGAPQLPPSAAMPQGGVLASKQASGDDATKRRRDALSTASDPGQADKRQASGGGSRDVGRRIAAELLPMVLSLTVGGLFFRWVMKRLDPNHAAEQRVCPHTESLILYSASRVSGTSFLLESQLVSYIQSYACAASSPVPVPDRVATAAPATGPPRLR